VWPSQSKKALSHAGGGGGGGAGWSENWIEPSALSA
jgi:hypothetical protein